jgi:hypothetical protein
MSDSPLVIHGPLAPTPNNNLIYSVTLANGCVVTNPHGFGVELIPAYAPIVPRRLPPS